MRGRTCSDCSENTGRQPDPTGRTTRTSLVGPAGYARAVNVHGPEEAVIGPRAPIEADRAAFVELRRASAASLGPWEPRIGDFEEQIGDQSFDRLLDRCESESDAPFLIHRISDDEIAGYVGLGQIFREPFRSCSIGSGSVIRTWAGDTARGECERAWRGRSRLNPKADWDFTGLRRAAFRPTTPASRSSTASACTRRATARGVSRSIAGGKTTSGGRSPLRTGRRQQHFAGRRRRANHEHTAVATVTACPRRPPKNGATPE